MSPFVWIVLVLGAAFAFLAFRKPTRGSMRLFRAGAMVVLAVVAIGIGVWGYQTENAPLNDPSLVGFCSSPDANLATFAADIVAPNPPDVQNCSAGTAITLSRDETVAIALPEYWNVDVGTRWSDFSIANPNVLREAGPPISLRGPADRATDYQVAVYRANQPGETTLSAVLRSCNDNLQTCDRGARWWVTIEVT